MLINISTIIEKYGKPKGIIHIGAHLAEEKSDYLKFGLNNTIWIEANPLIFDIMNNNILETEKAFNFAITDEDNKIVILNITNNSQSSSILELDTHKIQHPHIYVVDHINIDSIRMDTLIKEYNINIDNYDFINIDIQGSELLALKGFGNLLKNIKYIYTEVNINTLYKNCALMDDIDKYLEIYKFKRVETKMTDHEWGDALYLKEE